VSTADGSQADRVRLRLGGGLKLFGRVDVRVAQRPRERGEDDLGATAKQDEARTPDRERFGEAGERMVQPPAGGGTGAPCAGRFIVEHIDGRDGSGVRGGAQGAVVR